MSFLRLLKFALPILLGLGVLSVIVFDPFGSDSQKVLLLGGLVAFAAWAVLRHSREADEVEMAATKFGATTGATIGLLTAFVFVVAMRYVPVLAASIAQIADTSSNGLPPAAVGFALGSLSTILIVLCTGIFAKALWWSSKN